MLGEVYHKNYLITYHTILNYVNLSTKLKKIVTLFFHSFIQYLWRDDELSNNSTKLHCCGHLFYYILLLIRVHMIQKSMQKWNILLHAPSDNMGMLEHIQGPTYKSNQDWRFMYDFVIYMTSQYLWEEQPCTGHRYKPYGQRSRDCPMQLPPVL